MIVSPSSSTSNSSAVLISGSEPRRELDVDDRAGDGDDAAVLQLGARCCGSVTVIGQVLLVAGLT